MFVFLLQDMFFISQHLGRYSWKKCQFDKYVNFPTQFFLGCISNRFDAFEYREVFLKENLNDFLVDYNATNKLEMPKFHKNLMGKNNM